MVETVEVASIRNVFRAPNNGDMDKLVKLPRSDRGAAKAYCRFDSDYPYHFRRRKMNFIALCLIGREEPENIDFYIERWHNGDGGDKPLHEYLGFSKEDYGHWLKYPNSLHQILRCL